MLDEPTDGLDPVQRDEMLNIVVDVNRTFGIDVLLSSHVLEEVERVCDHVVALSEGKLIAQGSMTELAGASAGIELELVELAEKLSIPVATSLNAKAMFPYDHPLALGVCGQYSRACANPFCPVVASITRSVSVTVPAPP